MLVGFADAAARLRVLFPPDPGRLRLLAAVRATLAGLLTFLLVVVLGTVLPFTLPDRILGFAIGLFGNALVRDPTRRRQTVTLLLMAVVASAINVAATLLHPWPVVVALLVPVIMFAATYGGARGPRWGGIGVVALIAYIIGLVTRQPPGALPAAVATIWLGAADAALVRFLLLPERPAADVRRLRSSIRDGVALVLGLIAAAVLRGNWHGTTRLRLNSELDRLGEAMTMAETRIAALTMHHPEEARRGLHLLEVQLATERLARAARHDLGQASDRRDLYQQLRTIQHAMAADRFLQPPEAMRLASAAPLADALNVLAGVLHEGMQMEASPLLAPVPPPPPPPAGRRAALRPALQAALAGLLAVGCGELVAPSRWYWAAFAAFAMFQGTRSSGESITKVVQFMSGTLAGVVAGVLLATALAGHTLLTMAAIVGAVFLAFQAFMSAYAVMVFWITIILGLMFGLLGYFAPELLLMRLEETAAGAVCGILVSCLVLARPTKAVIQGAVANFLRALGATIEAALPGLLDGRPAPELAAALLEIEQRLRELHAAMANAFAMSRDAALRQRMLVLRACEGWARELGGLALHGSRLADPMLVAAATESADRIHTSLAGLLGRPGRPPVGDDPGRGVQATTHHDPPHQAVRLLLRIDAALIHLAARGRGPNLSREQVVHAEGP